MLKMALISYVNSAKAVWSIVAHPLEIFSKKGKNLKDYRIFGNSVQDGVPTPEAPIEVQSVGELTTKNLFDKDNLVVNRKFNVSKYTSTDTGVDVTPVSAGVINGFCMCDVGLAKDYVGKTLCFSWKPDDFNTSTSTKIIIADSSNSVVAESSANVILEDGTRYTTLTVNGEYTTEILRLRLYFSNIDTSVYNTLKFENIMLCESSEYVPYEPYQKYKVPVTARGKNLFDKTTSIAESYIDDANGEFKINTYLKYYASDYIEVLPNKTIYVTLQNAGNWGAFYDENKVFVSGYRYGEKIVPSNAKYLRITVIPAYLDTMQVEYGDTPTEYEPYIEPQTHNLYLNAPLRKLGEYADYIDFEKGVVVRRIRERTIGSYRWDKYSNSSDYNTGVLLYRYEHPVEDKRLFNGGWSDIGSILCNGLKLTTYNGGGVVDKSISERQSTTGSRSLKILTSQYDTVETMKEAFGDFKVCYILDDAYITEEKVTLPALPTFKGTTVYEVQTSTEPSGMQACYYE